LVQLGSAFINSVLGYFVGDRVFGHNQISLDFESSDFFEDWKHTVLLPEDWETILKGETFADFGKGYSYEGGEFEDYWAFAGGIDRELRVTNGDGGQAFIGTLREATIKKPEEDDLSQTPRPSHELLGRKTVISRRTSKSIFSPRMLAASN